MLLPIVRTPPNDDLSHVTALIYGATKIGKSTFCAQAEDAVFLATEPGLNSLDVYQVPIGTWEDFKSAGAELLRGEHQFKTIIIDTIDNAAKLCENSICEKYGTQCLTDGQLGYGKGVAIFMNEFQRVITRFASLPYGLYMVSHAMENKIEYATGDYIKMIPTLAEKPRRMILGMVDCILYCDLLVVKGEDGKTRTKRVIRTRPNRKFEAGDRTGRLPAIIDLNYAAFATAFNGENTESEEQEDDA